VRVLVRRDLHRDALVDAVAGHPVELGPRHLEHRDAVLDRDQQGLPQAGVPFGAFGNMERGDRDTGPQRLDHRVAAVHPLNGRVGVLPGRAAAAFALLGALLRLRPLVRGVLDPVDCLRRRALALQTAADPATGSGGRVPTGLLPDCSLALAVAWHVSFLRCW
jgi:hypothetical protein